MKSCQVGLNSSVNDNRGWCVVFFAGIGFEKGHLTTGSSFRSPAGEGITLWFALSLAGLPGVAVGILVWRANE